jgi:alpha-glucosidase
MENVPIPPELVQDPPAVNQPELAELIGRDPQRTPMQWDASPNAGFTPAGVQPWLPLAGDFTARNVAAQEQDPRSLLALFRALAALRRAEPALCLGQYTPVATGADTGLLAYLRTFPGADSFLVVLNLSDQRHALDLSGAAARAVIAIDTHLARAGEVVDLARLVVQPNAGLVLRLVL